MKSLVLELQREAMNSDSRLSDILRKAFVVATKLNVDEFKIWIEAELKGYPNTQDIPPYRNIIGTVKAWNKYNGWIPVIVEGTEINKFISNRDITQPISEIEFLCHQKKEGGILQVPLPHDLIMELFSSSKAYHLGMIPTLIVDKSQLVGILDAVRNEILNWSLELEKQGILGNGMSFSTEEVKMAKSTINIHSFKGILGDVSSSNIQIGDYSSIHEALKDNGVSQEERNELENLLDKIKVASPEEKKGLIQNGYEWLSRNASTIGTISNTIKGWFEILS
jgi:AbiTii